ncbi:MAG TPA: type III pantothenate kinase [Polyangiaceae bacterium]|nr:type III pantothenate kinase [Polyangiaceae bacterium]
MLLAIDVGNTNIVYGLFEGEKLAQKFRVESVRGRTADEYAVGLLALLSMRGVDPAAVDAAIIACVVPSLTEPMISLVRRAFHRDALVVGPGTRTGMAILIENPREVGADRIADAVAGYELAKGAVVVVDFGTSTNFDVVTPKGEYLGGVLAPGLQISADALFSRAAKLPRVEIVKPPRVVGRNTVHAMQSGIVYGYVGLVDGLVERILAELGYPCAVIATGGLASLIAPLSRTIGSVDDELTLVGLRILYDRNRS